MPAAQYGFCHTEDIAVKGQLQRPRLPLQPLAKLWLGQRRISHW